MKKQDEWTYFLTSMPPLGQKRSTVCDYCHHEQSAHREDMRCPIPNCILGGFVTRNYSAPPPAAPLSREEAEKLVDEFHAAVRYAEGNGLMSESQREHWIAPRRKALLSSLQGTQGLSKNHEGEKNGNL